MLPSLCSLTPTSGSLQFLVALSHLPLRVCILGLRLTLDLRRRGPNAGVFLWTTFPEHAEFPGPCIQ